MSKGKMMQLTEEQAELVAQGDHDDFETVEDGEWVSEHKYELQEKIVLHTPTGKHYAQQNSRSGSYYSDRYYEYGQDLIEVRQVEVKSLVWLPVKQD
jgi:hypothetical protein